MVSLSSCAVYEVAVVVAVQLLKSLNGAEKSRPWVDRWFAQRDESEQPGGQRQPGRQGERGVQAVVEGLVGGADDLLDQPAETGVGRGVLRDLAGLDGVGHQALERLRHAQVVHLR